MSQYSAVAVTSEAAQELRTFAMTFAMTLKRRVTMADALKIVVRVATAHPDEIQAVAAELGLTPKPKKGRTK